MLEQLDSYFNRYAPFSASEIESIFESLKIESYAKKFFLLEAGQTCHYKFFIFDGLVRTYYLDAGTEFITQFAIENWWVTNMESFALQEPSLLNIQTLEPSKVGLLHRDKLDQLYEKSPNLERAFRMMAENMLIAVQRKSDFFMKKDAEEKYQNLMSKIPNLTQRVPQYMIASYLEMTPEHLSSLRKKK